MLFLLTVSSSKAVTASAASLLGTCGICCVQKLIPREKVHCVKQLNQCTLFEMVQEKGTKKRELEGLKEALDLN